MNCLTFQYNALIKFIKNRRTGMKSKKKNHDCNRKIGYKENHLLSIIDLICGQREKEEKCTNLCRICAIQTALVLS